MKPIHKLNNGRGATLCHTCSVIISTGLTKDLYCEKCKQETLEQIDQNNPITKGSTALVYKQETLEEVAERYVDSFEYSIAHPRRVAIKSFINGAKWQQEQDKNKYSEEDMMFAYEQGARLALISQSPLALHKGEFPTPQEWFEQFKNK